MRGFGVTSHLRSANPLQVTLPDAELRSLLDRWLEIARQLPRSLPQSRAVARGVFTLPLGSSALGRLVGSVLQGLYFRPRVHRSTRASAHQSIRFQTTIACMKRRSRRSGSTNLTVKPRRNRRGRARGTKIHHIHSKKGTSDWVQNHPIGAGFAIADGDHSLCVSFQALRCCK